MSGERRSQSFIVGLFRPDVFERWGGPPNPQISPPPRVVPHQVVSLLSGWVSMTVYHGARGATRKIKESNIYESKVNY